MAIAAGRIVGGAGTVHSRSVIVSGPPTAVHSIHSAPPSTYASSGADSTAVPEESTSVPAIVRSPPLLSDPHSTSRAALDVSHTTFSWTSEALVQRWK